MTNAELEQAVALLDWDRIDRLDRLDRLSLQLAKRLHALGNAVQTFVETAFGEDAAQPHYAFPRRTD